MPANCANSNKNSPPRFARDRSVLDDFRDLKNLAPLSPGSQSMMHNLTQYVAQSARRPRAPINKDAKSSGVCA
jgi:hypothetical protein